MNIAGTQSSSTTRRRRRMRRRMKPHTASSPARVGSARSSSASSRDSPSSPSSRAEELVKLRPTASFFTGIGMRGELGFPQPMLHLLADDLRCRHGHMIGINDEVMFFFNDTATTEIYTVTRKVFEIVRHASRIAVNTSLGTDLVATFSPTLHWIPSDGRYREQGRWGNLPEGETFTCPLSVAGEIAADEMGDWFADKYGTLPPPLRIKIRAGRMVSVETPD